MSLRLPVILCALLAGLLATTAGRCLAAAPLQSAAAGKVPDATQLVALAPPPPQAPVAAGNPGHLSVRGPDIVDPSGRPILLRGWNWGHWGTAQPQDGADNAAQGANVVRIPLRWWGHYGRENIDSRLNTASVLLDPGHLKMLDDNIEAASRAHLWIVLFIDSDCGQNGTQNPEQVAYCDPGHQFPQGHNFYTDPAERARFIALWRFIAARYKNTPYIGMFEPLPEPGNDTTPPSAIVSLYAEIMKNIREVAPGIPFLAGPEHYHAKLIESVYNPQWNDVVYTGNLFGAGKREGGVEERIRGLTQFRDRHHVPVFVQQVGVRSSEDTPSLDKLKAVLGLLVRERIGFTYWQYRSDDYPHSYGAVVREKGGQWVQRPATVQAVSSFFKN
jgi:hypothetical protein